MLEWWDSFTTSRRDLRREHLAHRWQVLLSQPDLGFPAEMMDGYRHPIERNKF